MHPNAGFSFPSRLSFVRLLARFCIGVESPIPYTCKHGPHDRLFRAQILVVAQVVFEA